MIFALIGAFLDSIGTIFWKKASGYNVPKTLFSFLAYLSFFGVSIALYLLGLLDLSKPNYQILGAIIIMTILRYSLSFCNQRVFSTNKLSDIMVYKNLSKIFSIIVGYFIFVGETSSTTFFIALATIGVMILFKTDFKNLKLPNNFGYLLTGEILSTCFFVIGALVLKQITSIELFFFEYITGIIFIGSLLIYQEKIATIKNIDKKFYLYRLGAAHIGGVSYILSLIVIKNIGLVTSILLGYVGVAMTLIFSYFVFKDIPDRKQMLMTIIISAMVGLGFYFK